MKKKLFMILLTLLPMLSSAETIEIDGIYYDVNSSTVAVANNPSHYSGDVVIPKTVVYNGNTCRVTSINQYAFYDCSDLVSVTIPNSVTTQGEGAFSDCKQKREGWSKLL